MKITFLGAAKTVTGSCYLVETKSTRFLVDCGLFQGQSKENLINDEPFPFKPSDIDFILLTHAHIDHSGRIPKICNEGFKNEIIATKPTVELCKIMLPDSGHIQESENEWVNRKRTRAGKPPVEPLYTYQNALDCLRLFRSVNYMETVKLNDEISVRFNDAGHILGSSILEIWVKEKGEATKVVFSGDLGNKDIPILRDPSIIESADYLVIESTYGDRLHQQKEDKVEEFVNIINETIENGGNVVIPSFAVGRTQEVIYELNKHLEKYDEKLKKLFSIPVYVDSPLAKSATEVFRNNTDCFDEEAREYIENGDNPLDFPTLKFTQSVEESKALNESNENMIVISASGMCEAGRIKHHLKHNLWRKESTVIFVGYQAQGTLGRKLVDGVKKVKIFGEEISVNARIVMMNSFSGHADRDGLLNWINGFEKKPKRIFIVHGEEEVQAEFAKLIDQEFHIQTIIPSRGETYLLAKGAVATEYNDYRYNAEDFRKLAVIDFLETLKEEIEDMSDSVKSDLKIDRTYKDMDKLLMKLKNVENAIVEVLK